MNLKGLPLPVAVNPGADRAAPPEVERTFEAAAAVAPSARCLITGRREAGGEAPFPRIGGILDEPVRASGTVGAHGGRTLMDGLDVDRRGHDRDEAIGGPRRGEHRDVGRVRGNGQGEESKALDRPVTLEFRQPEEGKAAVRRDAEFRDHAALKFNPQRPPFAPDASRRQDADVVGGVVGRPGQLVERPGVAGEERAYGAVRRDARGARGAVDVAGQRRGGMGGADGTDEDNENDARDQREKATETGDGGYPWDGGCARAGGMAAHGDGSRVCGGGGVRLRWPAWQTWCLGRHQC